MGQLGAISVFQNIGPLQVVIILVIVLLLFGVGKLPQVGRGMGQAINEFRSAVNKKDEENGSDDENADSKA
ncbi:MAG: twin-arginine translocase TatA/TatE family subunit [Chloroflexota bacterium]